MIIPIIKIGNSQGIRLPKKLLESLEMNENIELEITISGILLKPTKKYPRIDWAQQFDTMHKNGDDKLLIGDLAEDDLNPEWQW